MFALFSHTPPAFRDTVVVRGERIYLRPLSTSDDAAMYEFASDPLVTQFLPWEPAPSVASVRPFLQDQVGRRRRGESMGFAIVRCDTGVMVGSTDLMELKAVRGQAELGYLLHRHLWGQGLMSEAVALTLAYGFETLALQKVLAYADDANTASRRVLTKAGLTQTATETRFVKGEARLYVRYELLREVWETTP